MTFGSSDLDFHTGRTAGRAPEILTPTNAERPKPPYPDAVAGARKTHKGNGKRGVKPATPGITESELAGGFVSRHAGRWRYVAEWGHWLEFDGCCWRQEKTQEALDLAHEICRQTAAAEPRMSESERRAVLRASTMNAITRLASADRRIATPADGWDADPWLLNTPGGVVDLRTGDIRPAEATDRMTKIAGATPIGECPTWLAFLDRVTNRDHEVQSYLQRFSGYCLTGKTIEEILLFLFGSGQNGKTVFIETLRAVLGEYAVHTPIETFMVTHGDRHPADLARMRGARLVTATETEKGRRWAESKIKEMTGGEPITARFMRGDFFEFKPEFKILISGNYKPVLRDVGESMKRRLPSLPFPVCIPPDERDNNLGEKLHAERNGVSAWALAGCLEWQKRGLGTPAAVKRASAEYFDSQDVVNEWIVECCITGGSLETPLKDLFASWKTFAEAGGEYVGTKRALADELHQRGYTRKRGTGGTKCHVMIGVKASAREPWYDRE